MWDAMCAYHVQHFLCVSRSSRQHAQNNVQLNAVGLVILSQHIDLRKPTQKQAHTAVMTYQGKLEPL